MKITFYGAAREVTGSCHLIEYGDRRILFDCGLRQGGGRANRLNRQPFPFAVDSLDAVVLSHAHLDHTGLLPKLVAAGYRGPIYATPATIALTEILLRDSAHLQEMESERKTRRNLRKGKPPILPLYTSIDVETTLPLLKPVRYHTDFRVLDGVTMRFHDAGHILGSAITLFEVGTGGGKRRLVMSGDLGQSGAPFLRDPERLDLADIVVMESTYGDRDHQPRERTEREFEEVLIAAAKTDGPVLIPAFAVGRSQDLIYELNSLYHTNRLPFNDVYLDSPMAIDVTRLYHKFHRLFDEETANLSASGQSPCDLPILELSRTREQSMEINRLRGPMIVIAAAGMCTGGRILHHLKHNLWRPEAHVIFVGYQAMGTLGRRIVDGADSVQIHGERIIVKAKVHTLGGFSAHAGQSELLGWHDGFTKGNPMTALVHGEPRGMDPLANAIEERRGRRPMCPDVGESVTLD